MQLPGRHGSLDSYRYGFQGQEKDDEIKGEGNSINYKYRMHDPRVGRFFAVDPLIDEYPYLTSYAFSGNRVIDARELEGMEPVVINGEIVAYEVQPGQGPSQIAHDINSSETKKKYGYSVQKPVTWSQVVSWNFEEYKSKGDWDVPNGIFDKNNETYKRLNINEYDVLFINQNADQNFVYENDLPDDNNNFVEGEPIEPLQGAWSTGFSGADVEAGTGGVGGSMSGYNFDVGKETIFWEGGSTVTMTTLSAQIGTPGVNAGLGTGSINFAETKEPSLVKILNSPSHTKTIGGISPIGIGAKYTETISSGYNSSLYSILAGTPGPVVSYGNSAWSHSEISVSNLKTAADSLRRAYEILKFNPGAKHAQEYIEKNDGSARPLKKGEL